MRDRRFLLTAAASIMLLLFCVLASIACGSKSVGFPTVIRSLFHLGEETFENNVVQARIPRTVFGILAGASLSVSGALMQAVTRNPIADPSILGVNTGASLFVVCGGQSVYLAGICRGSSDSNPRVWFGINWWKWCNTN